MRSESSQLQHRQRVDPERRGSRRRLARIGSEGERAQVSEVPEAPASRPGGPPTSTSSPRPSAARAAARLTGVRFKVPAETMSAKLANLPEGVSVARGRIEVRFDGAEDALERLFALAQALGNDYVRFEELVGR